MDTDVVVSMASFTQINNVVDAFMESIAEPVVIEDFCSTTQDLVAFSLALGGKSLEVRCKLIPDNVHSNIHVFNNIRQYTHGVLFGIYSWCGFQKLDINIEIPSKLKHDYIFKETEIITLRYNNTKPGWININEHERIIGYENVRINYLPLHSRPIWNVKLEYTPTIKGAYKEFMAMKIIFLGSDDYSRYTNIPQIDNVEFNSASKFDSISNHV